MTVKSHTLSNGFRIVTENMPSLQSAAIGIWVMAGARNELADQNGIAHFLEHMAFKGTKRRDALTIAETIEDVGGYINAYTSREATAYYARVLKDDVPLAFDVISDIVLNSIFDLREIEVERGVILQEIGQSLDTPDDVIFDWLQECAYPDQPIGRPILGPAERVRAFSQEDLKRFVAQHYEAGNLVLSAAGAVDHDELVRLAEDAFGHLPKSDPQTFQPAKFQSGETRVEKALEQAHIAMAFEAPSVTDKTIYTSQILGSVLGGGMSSRLFQELREKRGLCYTIFAQAAAYSDTGMMTIYAGTSGDEVGALAELTLDEIKRATDTMTQAELDRARAQMKAGLLMGLESPSSRAERMARMTQVWNRVPSSDEVIARIDAVSLDDLRLMATQMISTAPMAMALYGPIDKAPDWDALKARRAA